MHLEITHKDTLAKGDFWRRLENTNTLIGMTKFHNLEYLEYLKLGQFRNFCDVLLVALVQI